MTASERLDRALQNGYVLIDVQRRLVHDLAVCSVPPGFEDIALDILLECDRRLAGLGATKAGGPQAA